MTINREREKKKYNKISKQFKKNKLPALIFFFDYQTMKTEDIIAHSQRTINAHYLIKNK
jgi:hypothetical protein